MIAERLGRILVRLESVPGGFYSWVLVFFGVTFLRAFLEGILEESQTLGFRLETLQSMEMAFLHTPLFYLTTFSLAALLLSVLGRTDIAKTARVVLLFSPVILVAPVIDGLINQYGFQLHYFRDSRAAVEAMIYTFCPFTTQLEGVSPGMRIEVLLACIGGALYLWGKRRHVFWTAAGFVSIYVIALFAGYIPALFTLIVRGDIPENRIFLDGGIVFSDSRKYALIHLLLATLVVSASYLRAKAGRLGDVLVATRPVRSVFYMFATGFGLLLGAIFLRSYYPEFMNDPFLVPAIMATLASVFFIFQSQLILNDHFDQEIDSVSGKKSSATLSIFELSEGKAVGGVMLALSLLFATVLGYASFLIAVSAHVIGFVYSARPFRLKCLFPVNNVLIAVSILLATCLGFSLFAGRHTLPAFPSGVALFMFGVFTFVAAVKDIPDADGDKRGGVTTIATLFGARRSKIVTGAGVVAAYTAALFLLDYLPLLVVSVPAGILSAVALMKGREVWVFVLLFVSAAVLGFFAWNGAVLNPETGEPAGAVVGEYLKGVDSLQGQEPATASTHFMRSLDQSDHAHDYLLPQLLMSAAKAELRQGNLDEAYGHFMAAASHPTHPEEAYTFASAVQWTKGNPEAAAELLTEAVSLRPQSARLRLARGKMRMPFDAHGAFLDLDYAYRCRLEMEVTLSYLGDLARQQGRPDAARQFYRRALELNSESIPAWAGLAGLLLESGDHHTAIAHMLKVSTLLADENRHEEARGWLKRAKTLSQQEDFDR